ncbi:MAG: O-antigen ligase family protein [FCB group bacterium]|nr:O-antigen ligase family protein [FCB group bacterium]
MNSRYKFEKILVLIITIASCCVICLPLFFYPHSYYPHVGLKTLLFRLLVEIIFGAYIILAVNFPDYRPKKSPLLTAISVYITVMLITTLPSHSVHKSWWGTWDRMGGTFTYLHYYLCFIVITSVFRRRKEWIILLKAAFITGLLISLYAVLQHFEPGLILTPNKERVTSAIGSPILLGGYTLFSIFITILFLHRSRRYKALYLSIAVIHLIVLFLAASRGAFAGLLASMVLISIMLIILKQFGKLWAKAVVLIFGTIVLIIAFSFVFEGSPIVKSSYYLNRFSRALEGHSAKTRFLAWDSGIRGIKDSPVFGFGPENYDIAFNKYFNTDFYRHDSCDIWFDRAHNILIDHIVMMGIPGLLAYLILYIFIFRQIVSVYRQKKIDIIEFLSFIAVFTAYFGYNLFVFVSVNVLIMFYFMLGYLIYLERGGEKHEDLPAVHTRQRRARPAGTIIIISTLISFLLIIALQVFVNLPEARANLLLYKAVKEARKEHYDSAFELFRRSHQTALNKSQPAKPAAKFTYQLLGYFPKITSEDKRIDDLKTIIKWLNSAIEADCYNPQYYHLSACEYYLLAKFSGDSEYTSAGIETAQKCLELSPNRVETMQILVQLYNQQGDYGKAGYYQDKIAELSPFYAAGLHYKSGRELYNKKQYWLALLEFTQTVKLHPKHIAAYFYRAAAFNDVKEYDKALADFKMVIKLQAGHWRAHFNMGMIYLEKEDYNSAVRSFTEALKLKPDYHEALYQRGAAYLKIGDIDRALIDLRKANEYGNEKAKQIMEEIDRRKAGR